SPGLTEATVDLNMTIRQRMRLVIFQQDMRMKQSEISMYVTKILTATCFVYLIGMHVVSYYSERFSSTKIPMLAQVQIIVLILYFIIAIPLILLTRKMETISKKGVDS